jgi:DNA topoisomerase-1
VIVESPAKARAIGKLLGRKYLVRASLGHVRDLPKSQFGIDVEHGFTPKYIPIRGKGDVIKSLRDAARNTDRVLLGPDPDREGEAIAWHLQQILSLPEDSPCRIEFHEITKSALETAVKQPHPIDQDRVNSQQARRVLDRLVGYKLSPLLWHKIRRGLSAGRVQSVAVRLICDRQQEIDQFQAREYWIITACLRSGENSFEARLLSRGKEKLELNDEDAAKKVLADLQGASYVVQKITSRQRQRRPLPPFTTSTLQQEAGRLLNLPVRKTMQIAQQLYEGLDLGKEGTVGLITYMRTDSPQLSQDARISAREFIRSAYGPEYVPEAPPFYKSKGRVQGAHEAIRPTATGRLPDNVKPFLSRDQYRLYKLIWERFVACQMSPAVLEATNVEIAAGAYTFRASGSVVRFPGWLRVYRTGPEASQAKSEQASKETEFTDTVLPPLSEGELLELVGLKPKQHFTQPPPCYTEASLVKALEEKGIGRPSTYAPTIETIQTRGYVVKQDKNLAPTELGRIVVDLLKEYFPQIIDIEFTANMEEKLDQVEEGNQVWQQIVDDFYRSFEKDLVQAEQEIQNIPLVEEQSEQQCPKCGRYLTVKQGRYGKFLACPGFPGCRYTQRYFEPTGITCPLCGGMIVAKKSRRGRKFWGCTNYPDCDFSTWDEPSPQSCPVCGHFLVYAGKARKLSCPNCDRVRKEKKGTVAAGRLSGTKNIGAKKRTSVG